MDTVDLSLVLALDCSASVTYEEFGLLAGGLAAALRDPEVVSGLTGGAAGACQCALLLFSGVGAQEVLVEWTRIGSPADAAAFADAVDNVPRIVRAGLTAIGEALMAAGDLMEAAPVIGAAQDRGRRRRWQLQRRHAAGRDSRPAGGGRDHHQRVCAFCTRSPTCSGISSPR